jgi:DNA-binding FadR family transcriptional regulator
MHQRPASGEGPLRRGDVHRAHAAIVDAICADDAELAARRMRRHLGAMRAWVQ